MGIRRIDVLVRGAQIRNQYEKWERYSKGISWKN